MRNAPGDGSDLDDAVFCTRVLAQVLGRRLLSGTRTKTVLRPWAFKGGDQVCLCQGSLGDTERVYSRTTVQGREHPTADRGTTDREETDYLRRDSVTEVSIRTSRNPCGDFLHRTQRGVE